MMQGKTVLLTGGTSGIGRAAATALAAQGATMVIVGRQQARGEVEAGAIRTATGAANVAFMQADLSSQADTRRFARAFGERYDRLDVLVNNAGAIFSEREVTAEGLERTFALNHLGYFLLTHLLLPMLRTGAPSRIVNVSSGAHAMGRIAFDDLQGERKYSAWGAYAQSKLANVLFTRELARRLAGSDITVNALHPGMVASNFGRGGGGWIARRLMPLIYRFARTPEQGAETVIFLATSPEVAGVSGAYFANKRPARAFHTDDAVARRLWERSLVLAGVSEPYGATENAAA